MSVTVDFVPTPSSDPWLEAAMAFDPAGTASEVGYPYGGSGSPDGIVSSLNVGDLMVMVIYYRVADSGYTLPPYTPTGGPVASWNAGPYVHYDDGAGFVWGLQCFWAIASVAGSYYVTTGIPSSPGGSGYMHCIEFTCGVSGGFTAAGSATAQDLTGNPTLTFTPTTLSPIVIGVAFVNAQLESLSMVDGAGFNNWFSSGEYHGGGEQVSETVGEYMIVVYDGPPPPAPPLRYKKIPLTLNFASSTWDQANRLALYELLRLCGLDSSGLGSLSAFCIGLFPDIAGQPYSPPTGLMLAVWSEAVDASWNILKNALLGSGGGPGPVCGRRVTIDPSLSVEYAGEWEVMAMSYQPFQPDVQTDFGSDGSGSVSGVTAVPRSAASGSGVITLTLRTYDERVLGLDTSQTASYLVLPGPIAGDEFS